MRATPYVAIGLGAFALRLAYLHEWHGTPLDTVLVGDAAEYDRWAREIARGNWSGDAVFYQAPLYPYFMAAVYALAGPSLTALRIVQLVCGSLSAVLVALAGRRFFDERVGILAGAMLACYGPAIHADGLIQKGAIGGLLMALLLFEVGELSTGRGGVWLFGTGVTLGLFALARENALLLPPVIAAWLAIARRGQAHARTLAQIAVLAAGLALVLVPVGLRNAAFGGRFLVTTSQAGPNFWIGNNPQADGRYVPLREGRGGVRYERTDATELAEEALGRELTPAEVSSYWFDRAGEWVREHPGAWLALLARKVYLVAHAGEIMDTDSLEAHRDASWVLGVTARWLHFGVVFPLAALGVWVTRGAWQRLSILYALSLVLAGSVALFFVMARYRNPLVPVVLLFAAAAAIEIVRLVRARAGRALAGAATAVLAVGVAVNWPLAATADPRSITYYSLGQALAEQGRLDEARPQLERALAVEPDFAEARVRLADVLSRSGDPTGAEREALRALDLDPAHADAHTILGSLRLAAGRLDEAAALYERTLELDPSNPTAHNNLAVVYARQGRLEEAVAHWAASLEAEPNDPAVLVNLGQVLSVLGRPADARDAFTRALALAPGHPEARRWLERTDAR